MAKSKRKPFDAAGPFVVRRRFLFNGEWTYPGDPFEIEFVDKRRVKQLWDNRQIDVGTSPEEKRAPRIHNPDRDIEQRLTKMIDWRSMNRIELIEYVRETTGVKCNSKKEAIAVMTDWEANH